MSVKKGGTLNYREFVSFLNCLPITPDALQSRVGNSAQNLDSFMQAENDKQWRQNTQWASTRDTSSTSRKAHDRGLSGLDTLMCLSIPHFSASVYIFLWRAECKRYIKWKYVFINNTSLRL